MRALRASAISTIAMLAASPALAADIGPSLDAALDAAGATQKLEVIVSFDGDGAPTADQVAILEDLGLTGITFQALPIAGVMATPSQVTALDNTPGVRSLWLNEQLQYDNDASTKVTGVDRMRVDPSLRNDVGVPYSGKGIGVLINDSGVDGNHPDLAFGSKTVQNVAAQLNLASYDEMLPITWVENVPDTDIGGGHGTHVAGIVAGTGAASGGVHEGVAPGADIIGYGSGAGLFILDTLGAFDYALVNQFRYNIRVVANSFGSTSGTGSDFDPDDPNNIATKKLVDRGIIVVISAGNSGSGEGTITGNFKKAPWIVTVAAGDTDGGLADFSSRGVDGKGGEVTVDGERFVWEDRPTLTSPGVNTVSTKAKTDALSATGTGEDGETVYYTVKSGTSMASPHVSGIVALMLEANPKLSWREVKSILQETATNMPGREAWEVGAGYVNAHAAVTMAASKRTDYGDTLALGRTFNATLQQSRVEGPDFSLTHNPVGPKDVQTFTVAEGLSTVIATANVSDNTTAIVLRDPDGNRYGSSISLPVLGQNIAVTAPAVPGEWTIELGGIGALSGVALDPLGVTNGVAVPVTPVDVDVDFNRVDGFTGLDDVAGHPARGFVEAAVAERLVDARRSGFRPDAKIRRSEMADYLTLGGGVRQYRAADGSTAFTDVSGTESATAEAVTARGAALRDMDHSDDGVMASNGTSFDPRSSVDRDELAYSMVQSLGMQDEAEAVRDALGGGQLTASFRGERVPVTDSAAIPAEWRGHAQLAIDLELMTVRFDSQQGPYDLEPTVTATFSPDEDVTRAGYAFSAVALHDRLSAAE